jgi:tetratricopeptide (TPR) repeat protein
MTKRSRKRTKKRFVYDQKRGKIFTQGSQQTLERQSGQIVVPKQLANAFRETSRVVGPLVEEWHLPPIEAVEIVILGTYYLLLDESGTEEPPEDALTSLTATILHLWEQGSLHMEATFPYSFRQFDQAVRAGEMEKKSEKLTFPDSWLKLGSRALAERSYILASVFFSKAADLDEDWETDAFFWYGVACLHCKRVDEAIETWEADCSDRYDSLDSHLLLEWLQMGQFESQQAYLSNYREHWDIADEDDTLDVFASMGDENVDPSLYSIYHAIEAYLRGNFQSSLERFSTVRGMGERDYLWMIGFWEALDYASLDQIEQAHHSLQEALEDHIPAVLLLPSRWLSETRPDTFKQLFRPLLMKHSLLDSTEVEGPKARETSSPSHGSAIPMSKLFESYIEAQLIRNEELHEQARQRRDTYAKEATVVGRVNVKRKVSHPLLQN